jgi:hypothetical protein
MTRLAALLAASLVFTSAQAAGRPRGAPVALERKLHGAWKGGACQGDWVFGPDGTFELKHYTPGGNRLTGTWEVRWDALPPTLVLTCLTSDDPGRFPAGKMPEVKLLQLDDEALAYQYPGGKPIRCTRLKK